MGRRVIQTIRCRLLYFIRDPLYKIFEYTKWCLVEWLYGRWLALPLLPRARLAWQPDGGPVRLGVGTTTPKVAPPSDCPTMPETAVFSC